LEKTLILVLGDHGEEFGEHGSRFHGSNLYEAQVRTAALLRIPGVAARRVPDPVSLLDFAPTLLDLMGLAAGFESLMGRNLVPVLAGGALEPGLFLESFRVDDGTEALLAFVEWPLKLIYTQGSATLELYHLLDDPLERRNLYFPGNPNARRLEERLYRHLESSVGRGTHAAPEF
jgi:arylsulfatase A-like enzyme